MFGLKVLTLNCWAVPIPGLGCKLKNERLLAIRTELQKGEHDIVVLQEIWLHSDFEDLRKNLNSVYPHAHYWRSGALGSGVCIFSKHVILETFQHVYTLNGYPDRPDQGDWYAGKLVGLALVQVGEFKVNVFATHTHADHYTTTYNVHRFAQSFELSQFVKLTSSACDAVIVAGDLNSKPDDLCYKVVMSNGNLQDAWLAAKGSKGHVHTSDRVDNSFYPSTAVGQCIDYILFRNNLGVDMSCMKCELTMGRVPGETYNYSDHEGVTAEFVLRKALTVPALQKNTNSIESDLSEGVKTIEEGESKVQKRRFYYIIKMLLILAAMVTISWMSSENSVLYFLNRLLTPCFSGSVMYCFWTMHVCLRIELNSLKAVKADMLNILRHNKDRL